MSTSPRCYVHLAEMLCPPRSRRTLLSKVVTDVVTAVVTDVVTDVATDVVTDVAIDVVTSYRVVAVAVDREDGKLHVEVGVLEVDVWEGACRRSSVTWSELARVRWGSRVAFRARILFLGSEGQSGRRPLPWKEVVWSETTPSCTSRSPRQ